VDGPPGEVNYRLFNIDKGNMDLRIAKSAAQVAILFPETSRNMAGSAPSAGAYMQEMLGTSQTLSLLHIDHAFISEADLTLENLRRFKVLILGNAPYLSDEQIQIIKAFADGGGVVAASYMTGVADELGRMRGQDMIAEIFGFNTRGKAPAVGKAFSVSVKDSEVQAFEKELLYRQLPYLPAAENTPKLYNRNGKSRPAVVEKTFGQGKFVYYPGMIGPFNHASELMVGKKFNFTVIPGVENLHKKLLSDLAGEHRAWYPVAFPEKIVSNAYYQNGELIIHLLNATGSDFKAGDPIKFMLDKRDPFPEVKDLELVVRSNKYTSAYAVSPDFEGKKVLTVEQHSDGLLVKIPGNCLKVYTLIYIK